MAECLGSLFRGYLGIVSQISGAPRLNRGLKYAPKPLRHHTSGPNQSQEKPFNLLDENFTHVSNKNSIIQCYMWSSISNESSRAHKFNYPIVMPVNISRCAGIVRQLHPLKAWLLLTAFYGCFKGVCWCCGSCSIFCNKLNNIHASQHIEVRWNQSSIASFEGKRSD